MARISVLIPDAEHFSKRVARCLDASRQVILHGLSKQEFVPLRTLSLYATFSAMGEMALSSWLERVDDIATKLQVDVVLPTSHFSIRALSEHGRSLACADRLAHLPDYRTYDMATDKASLSDFLALNEIPHPRTVLVKIGAETPNNLSTLNFPVLAKPPLLWGGRGIQRCNDRAELELFLADRPAGETWVVQELIEGHDVCVNVLARNGKIIASTVQHAVDQSSFYGPPPNFEFRCDRVATDTAQRLIEKLAWSGIANIDMRFDVKRNIPVVLEVNGRYWASLLGSMNAGVNFPLLACEAVSGRITSNVQPRRVRYFRGKSNMFTSLIGGGKRRIKPAETDLRYLLRDPILLARYLTSRATKSIRAKSIAATGC